MYKCIQANQLVLLFAYLSARLQSSVKCSAKTPVKQATLTVHTVL